jgi:hypothetical protein
MALDFAKCLSNAVTGLAQRIESLPHYCTGKICELSSISFWNYGVGFFAAD